MLAEEPVQDWGGLKTDPAEEFDHRNGFLAGKLTTDGGLMVIDRFRVRRYDHRGVEIASTGTLGSGPGEFRLLTTLCLAPGDIALVYDQANGRLSVVRPGGGIEASNLMAGVGQLLDQPCLADGSLVVQGGDGTVRRVGRSGQVEGTLGRFARARDVDGLGTTTMIGAAGEFLYVGDGRESAIRVIPLDGRPEWRIGFDEEPKEMPDTLRGRFARFDAPGRATRAEVEAEIQKQGRSIEFLPYYDRMIATDHGVWLRDLLIPGDHTSSEFWTYLTTDGQLIGRLEIPAPRYDGGARDAEGRPPPPPLRPILQFADTTRALVLRHDSLGAAHFSLYRLAVRQDR